MKNINKQLKSLKVTLSLAIGILGLLPAIIVLFVGLNRVSSGISTIRISDSATAQFMSVGVLYIQISVLVIVGLVALITYILTKKV